MLLRHIMLALGIVALAALIAPAASASSHVDRARLLAVEAQVPCGRVLQDFDHRVFPDFPDHRVFPDDHRVFPDRVLPDFDHRALDVRLEKVEGQVREMSSHPAPEDSLGGVDSFAGGEAKEEGAGGGAPSMLLTVVFIHEVWLFMQHANVLLNPYLQRLDRKYGIALLRQRMYWVIAGVLGAYWARETLSMAFFYPHVSPSTRIMISVSCIYHWAKIALVSMDASNKCSPRLGIMSLLIDHCTYPSLAPTAVCVAVVWSVHTAMCQVTGKSTATLFVEAFKSILHPGNTHHPKGSKGFPKTIDEEGGGGVRGADILGGRDAPLSPASVEDEAWLLIANLAGAASIAALTLAWGVGFVGAFTLYLGVSLSAALVVAANEAVRAAQVREKSVVRHLLTRDKHSASSSHPLPYQGLDTTHDHDRSKERAHLGEQPEGSVARRLGHLAGWCAPSAQKTRVPEVVFLAHPTTLSSAFAAWMRVVSPLVWLYSIVWARLSPVVCEPYLFMDQFAYGPLGTQVWLSRAFGWQFLASPRMAERNIENSLRAADALGVKVFGLGALNKAEFINGSGQRLVDTVRPTRTCVVHGNTLTAAAVTKNVLALLVSLSPSPALPPRPTGPPQDQDGTGQPQDQDTASWPQEQDGACPTRDQDDCAGAPQERPSVFLTGPTSKVGRAVALALLARGVDVCCLTSSDSRFAALLSEAGSLSGRDPNAGRSPQTLMSTRLGIPSGDNSAWENSSQSVWGALSRARALSDGVFSRVWVVGKFDPRVRAHIPRGACAVVFAVPCPLTIGGGAERKDVTVIDGGLMRLDVSRCSPRTFPVLLPANTLYACHAAALVHASQTQVPF
ncbi:hypothetical protein T484DRAFT_1782529 [Baffinella frigidus]|nr:hypothetical protein T484DRAFT_1782529 [Cryptophyta sp. CCMP2293]